MLNRLLLVDGNNLAMRCQFTKVSQLATSDGRRTGVIHGVLKGIRYAMRQLRISEGDVVVAWDGGRAPDRLALYPDYKANRTRNKTPEDAAEMQLCYDQMEQLQEILPAAGMQTLKYRGVEADDILSIAAHRASGPAVIFSTDHDFHHIVSDRITLFDPKKGHLTKNDVLESWGVSNPRLILEMRAMIGDKSDNIAGVHRIGPKTALKIVHGDVGKWEAALQENAGVIARNRVIMRLPSTIEDSMIPYGLFTQILHDIDVRPTGCLRTLAKFCADLELQEVMQTWG